VHFSVLFHAKGDELEKPLFIRHLLGSLAPRLKHLWVGLPFFVILYRSLISSIPLFDFWWHLKMGQIIVQKWAIPRVDVFSFTAAGKLYILQNWLAEVLFYGIYSLGGPALILFANSLLMASILIPIYLLCRKSSPSLAVPVFAVTLVSFCIPGNVRPQVFSYVLFALCYWLVSSYCGGKHKRIWFLPILFVFWVNLHGAFVLGLALIGIYLVCETARSYWPGVQSHLDRRKLPILGIVLLLCILGTLVNPEGYKIYEYVLTVTNSPSVRQFVSEWQPPAINQIPGIFMFYGPFFILTFVLIGSKKRPTMTDCLLYGVFSIFGFMAIRNSAWFQIIAAPLIARYMPPAEFWGQFSKWIYNCRLPLIRMSLARKENLNLNSVILAGAIVALVIQSPWLHKASLLEQGTPVKAMDFIQNHQLKGNIYHSQSFGDYLIWRLWPLQRSFFDGRVHLYDTSLVEFYLQVMSDSHWEEMLEKYQIKYLLLPKGKSGSGEMNMIEKARKSKNWKSLYEDSVSVLFEKSP
jgi:hypothetical protein